MISTTYLSSATGTWTTEELEALLEVCRANNAEAGVTGVLLHAGRSFIQTLEGPAESVDGVMARVRADDRHTDVEVLRRDEIAERDFADWSMGFRQLAVDRAEQVPGFTDYLRTGHIAGAGTRRRAAETFHRVFRDQMGDPLQPRDPR